MWSSGRAAGGPGQAAGEQPLRCFRHFTSCNLEQAGDTEQPAQALFLPLENRSHLVSKQLLSTFCRLAGSRLSPKYAKFSVKASSGIWRPPDFLIHSSNSGAQFRLIPHVYLLQQPESHILLVNLPISVHRCPLLCPLNSLGKDGMSSNQKFINKCNKLVNSKLVKEDRLEKEEIWPRAYVKVVSL